MIYRIYRNGVKQAAKFTTEWEAQLLCDERGEGFTYQAEGETADVKAQREFAAAMNEGHRLYPNDAKMAAWHANNRKSVTA